MGEKLGQHFLKDKNALIKIEAALNLKSKDTVIEIGAGHGELTEELKAKSAKRKIQSGKLKTESGKLEEKNEKRKIGMGGIKIIAVEKDSSLAELLKKKFEEDENVEVVEGDALKTLNSITNNLQQKKYKIAGNIPYYITGHLLKIISKLDNKPEICVFTIQKEVAIRMSAEPPRMNRLAAAVQFWAEPEIIEYLPAKLFSPPPEVDSALIRLQVVGGRFKVDAEKYYRMVRILFQQPRKTILNNLASGLDLNRLEITKMLNKIGVSPSSRPQDMTIENIIELANSLAEK